MNRLIALFALVAVAFAEPEADPALVYNIGATPFVYAHHGNAHATAGMVHHPSGAVTPDDTASVKAAKVQHHAAKVHEYMKKPYVYSAPVVATAPVVTKPVVSYTAPVATASYVASPVTYTAGLTYPTTTYHHSLLKREAESDSQYLTYANTGLYSPYAAYTGYTGMYNYPYTTYSGAYTYPYATTGYRFIAKREADSDSQYFYNNAYTYPYTTYSGAYNYPYSTYGAVVRPSVYGAYSYPYVY